MLPPFRIEDLLFCLCKTYSTYRAFIPSHLYWALHVQEGGFKDYRYFARYIRASLAGFLFLCWPLAKKTAFLYCRPEMVYNYHLEVELFTLWQVAIDFTKN